MDTSSRVQWGKCLRWTIKHLAAHGDTDIFPVPVEYKFLSDMSEQASEQLAQTDPVAIHPISLVEKLVPKGRVSFRVAHQMFPVDCVLFKAATAFIGGDIEKARLPVVEQAAFSYRFSPTEDGDFYSELHTYHDWLMYQSSMVLAERGFTDVVKTDIADFYQRIYHHRLANALAECSQERSMVKLITNYIRSWRARQSFGIPVGGAATRLLAELLLNDTDHALKGEGYAFTRYVDDCVIWVTRSQDVYDALTYLAQQLAMNEGLARGGSKTGPIPFADYVQSLKTESWEGDDQAQQSATERLYWAAYESRDDEGSSFEELQARDLIAELDVEIQQSTWDAGRVRVLLRALTLTKKEEALNFIDVRLEELLPFAKDLLGLLVELKPAVNQKSSYWANRLAGLLLSRPVRRLQATRA